METRLRLPDTYFERLYHEDPDPWAFETSAYERRKAEVLLASLPRDRYTSAFEPGCANGALTERLAARAERILGMELVPAVAERARSRFALCPAVEIATGAIPDDWPADRQFDLILLSEVGYYLTPEGLAATLALARQTLAPGGDLVTVNFLGATDSPLSGADVEAAVRALPWGRCLVRHDEPEFLLTGMRYEPD